MNFNLFTLFLKSKKIKNKFYLFNLKYMMARKKIIFLIFTLVITAIILDTLLKLRGIYVSTLEMYLLIVFCLLFAVVFVVLLSKKNHFKFAIVLVIYFRDKLKKYFYQFVLGILVNIINVYSHANAGIHTIAFIEQNIYKFFSISIVFQLLTYDYMHFFLWEILIFLPFCIQYFLVEITNYTEIILKA